MVTFIQIMSENVKDGNVGTGTTVTKPMRVGDMFYFQILRYNKST